MPYPDLAPTSRAYSAGTYPYKTYKSQNGVEARILYGDKRTGMTLELSYDNIADAVADDFIAHYDDTKGGYATFALPASFRSGWRGSAGAIDVSSGNLWRYDSAPDIRSVRPGISSVTVKLVGVL